ncbi:hypothetical protein [Bradyrhizobium sp. 33ap4]|uniref:hypothetical protein n=1 Tax=Bradyrhizobium sp. 33ap4 TaxID=3061630 RepID=UPI00292E976A|nr:hypothetical protein [Bradyrhizobium sp. 33ap4]
MSRITELYESAIKPLGNPECRSVLGNEKYVFAGGVVAAFECKLTLRTSDIKRAFSTASIVKRKAPTRLGTPYDELNGAPIFGLLAHSKSLGNDQGWHRLYDAVQKYAAETSDHPRELLDVICVADTATIALGKHVLVGKGLSEQELQELNEIGEQSAVAAMYVVQDEAKRHVDLDFSGAILAGLVYDLTYRMAFDDPTIRPWADHLSGLGFYGGIGIPLYCSEEVLSDEVRQRLKHDGASKDHWSKWNRNLP